MNQRAYDRGALVAGLLFIALGVLFLLDRLEVWAVQAGYVWAILLIGLGLAVLLGEHARGQRGGP